MLAVGAVVSDAGVAVDVEDDDDDDNAAAACGVAAVTVNAHSTRRWFRLYPRAVGFGCTALDAESM